jgi:hypothetical protein
MAANRHRNERNGFHPKTLVQLSLVRPNSLAIHTGVGPFLYITESPPWRTARGNDEETTGPNVSMKSASATVANPRVCFLRDLVILECLQKPGEMDTIGHGHHNHH